jgi:hypothetical protein
MSLRCWKSGAHAAGSLENVNGALRVEGGQVNLYVDAAAIVGPVQGVPPMRHAIPQALKYAVTNCS